MSTILIIENDESIRYFMRELLELALTGVNIGIAIEAAGSGAACLALLQQHIPDLILLQVSRSDARGIALYQTIRQQDRLARVPVLFVTSTPNLVHQATLEGPYACLAKPFRIAELVEQVQALLGLPATADAVYA